MKIRLSENEKKVFAEASKNCFSISRKNLKSFVEEFRGLHLSDVEFDIVLDSLYSRELISLKRFNDGDVWIHSSPFSVMFAEQNNY